IRDCRRVELGGNERARCGLTSVFSLKLPSATRRTRNGSGRRVSSASAKLGRPSKRAAQPRSADWRRSVAKARLCSKKCPVEALSLLDLVSKTDVSHSALIKPARGPPAIHRASAGGCGEPARARRRGGC